ncbi:MAG: hypothetical protein JWP76_5430, partial [Dactylosporangium sp.]|nr:hypothetical protein [Dactylosporangium sp.]
ERSGEPRVCSEPPDGVPRFPSASGVTGAFAERGQQVTAETNDLRGRRAIDRLAAQDGGCDADRDGLACDGRYLAWTAAHPAATAMALDGARPRVVEAVFLVLQVAARHERRKPECSRTVGSCATATHATGRLTSTWSDVASVRWVSAFTFPIELNCSRMYTTTMFPTAAPLYTADCVVASFGARATERRRYAASAPRT